MERRTSAQNKQILKRILAQEGNGKCADCKTSTHPRWASWNIGVLICIRCSGIHRSLGTHISKVRSIDLDVWTDAHLEQLVKVGNNKANEYWEARLPPNYVPDESKIVNFIRTKYELKRWIPDSDLQQDKANDGYRPPVPPKVRTSTPTPTTGGTGIDLLDLGTNYAVRSAPPTRPSSATPSLLDIGVSAQNNARPTPSPTITKKETVSRTEAPKPPAPAPAAPAPQPQVQRSDLKKSILSLYSKPKAQNQPQHTAPAPKPAPMPSYPKAAPMAFTSAPSSSSDSNFANSISGSKVTATEPEPEPAPFDDEAFMNVWN